MKSLFSALALFFTLLAPVFAQEGNAYGFLNIANLIPGELPCHIQIGGKDVAPDGLLAGGYTGWFLVKTGPKQIKITMDEIDPASGEIDITEGVAKLITIYLEPNKRRDAKDKPLPPRIRIKSFPTFKTKGYGLKFVSLCPDANRFQLGTLKLDPKPFELVDVPKWNGGAFNVLRNGKTIGKISARSESGAFYLLVGTDHNGAYTSTIVSANDQEVPAYLIEEKAKP